MKMDPRARNIVEHVAKYAESPKGLPNYLKAMFHSWNPNGIVAEWREVCDDIFDAVDMGFLRSGAITAYGSGNDWAVERLLDLTEKRAVQTDYLNIYVNRINEYIKMARDVLYESGYYE